MVDRCDAEGPSMNRCPMKTCSSALAMAAAVLLITAPSMAAASGVASMGETGGVAQSNPIQRQPRPSDEEMASLSDSDTQASTSTRPKGGVAIETELGEEESERPSASPQARTTGGLEDTVAPGIVAQSSDAMPKLQGEAHVQNIGWQKGSSDAKGHLTLGTTGQSLRMEALRLGVVAGDSSESESMRGKAHVQDVGWMDWKSTDQGMGTTDRSKRMEAIRLKLSDELAKSYDLWYRVHVQDKGWMGWTSNGQLAGTAGLGLRIEAVELQLVAHGTVVSDVGGVAYEDNGLSVNAHVQNIGWQGNRSGYNVTVGTVGQALRMEALCINRPSSDISGDITYEAHVQDVGWQGARKNGSVAGSTGSSRRIEALSVSLSGQLAEQYDVWYRLHIQDGGWLAWASNGQRAGSEGLSMRVETVQVALLPKNSRPDPSGQSIPTPFIKNEDISYRVSTDGGAWRGYVSNGTQSGPGSDIRAFDATVSGDLSGSVAYSAHVANVGWMPWTSDGNPAGDDSQTVEAFAVSLSGDVGRIFSVWYRGFVTGKGWTGWAHDGAQAGSVGLGLPLTDIQMCLRSKASPAPGPTTRALITRPTVNIVQMIYPQLSHGAKPAHRQKYIVMHDTEGIGAPENVVYGWVAAGNYVAAHFVIGLDGRVVQCVPMDDIAHHAGWGGFGFNARYGVSDESWDDRRGTAGNRYSNSYGMNSFSIGIELVHVGASHAAYPEAQLRALDGLIAYIDNYYGFESQIIQHKDWTPGNSDCSDEFQPILANLRRTRTHNGA